MEHEDNAQYDNYLQSAQQNLQIDNNTGNGDALVGLGLNVDAHVGCVGARGEVGKYDDLAGENDVEDENELKYIKEMNQSEKEQAGAKQQQALHVGNGKSHEEVVDAVDDEDDYDDENMPSMQYRNNGNDEHLNGAAKDDLDAMHTDVGDFSQTSNTASTAEGGCIDMLQVQQQQQQQQQHQHLFDEEDPSSNGTSSLSENAPIQQQLPTSFDFFAENDDFMQNKENSDPKEPSQSPIPRPTELNFEVHSHLNPDAKEFVPSFGSNATSPTMSETGDGEHVGEPVDQPFSGLSRHILLSVDDDVVARSPRKGREMDMDSENFVLPASELDFGNEANKRPHDFEQEEDLICDQQENAKSPIPDSVNLMEHETEKPVNVQPTQTENDDLMNQSIYLTENGDMQQEEAIENVLNSVQPLPTDIESLNSSFVEDVYVGTPEEARAMEDLLSNQMDAVAEHISHPPSIEEMQMNLQNVNNKDLALEEPMNLDMNSAAHMQESFYMEKQPQVEPFNKEEIHDEDGFYAQQFATNESLLMDTSIPFNAEHNVSTEQQHQEMLITNDDFGAAAKVIDYDEQNIVTNMSSPSPKSTVEEKHLMEETKEQLVAKTIQDGQQFVEELGKKMENLLSSGIDCDLKQVVTSDLKPVVGWFRIGTTNPLWIWLCTLFLLFINFIDFIYVCKLD